MSDDEYDDELPPITVNSSVRQSNTMQMPSAEELARGRAREAECERELRRLREEHAPDDPAPTAFHTADSSGSEGETALAAAVNKLQMLATSRSQPLELGALLPPLLARLPLDDALAGLAASAAGRDALTDAMCDAALAPRLPAGGAAAVAAWLCLAAAAAPSRPARRRSRRALHKMLSEPPLDDLNSEDSRTLKAAVLDGLDEWDGRGGRDGKGSARVLVADAVAAARAPLAALLHRRLLAAALADLLDCDPAPGAAACLCEWAAASVSSAASGEGRGALWLRVVGRVARACPARSACAARARLLAALPAPRPGDKRLQPDRLEVLVGASKLQLLFRR